MSAETKKELRIFPDSSWLIAVIDEKDSHYKAARSSLGALMPYDPIFYIAPMVYLETMSRLIRKHGIPVKKCSKKIKNFLSGCKIKNKTSFDIEEIEDKFTTFSRLKIKELTPIDFYVVSEGMLLGANILTCDIKMFKAAQKYYKKTYFMSDVVRGVKSDLGRLISDVQNE